jgi:hypothetical protein
MRVKIREERTQIETQRGRCSVKSSDKVETDGNVKRYKDTHPHRLMRLHDRWNCTSSPSSGSSWPRSGANCTSRVPVKCIQAPTALVWPHGNVGCDVIHKPSYILTMDIFVWVRKREPKRTGDRCGPLSHTVTHKKVALIHREVWGM